MWGNCVVLGDNQTHKKMGKEKILLDALNTFGNFTSVEQEFNANQLEVIYEAMNQVLHMPCDCEPHTFYEWEKDENKCSQCGKMIYEQTDL